MAEHTTVGEIRRVIHEAYPPQLAEPWDAVGLVCGDPTDEVSTVAFALDCTQEVADKAVELGAQMLVVHHPLLLRGVTSVAADTPKGKVIHTLIRNGVPCWPRIPTRIKHARVSTTSWLSSSVSSLGAPSFRWSPMRTSTRP